MSTSKDLGLPKLLSKRLFERPWLALCAVALMGCLPSQALRAQGAAPLPESVASQRLPTPLRLAVPMSMALPTVPASGAFAAPAKATDSGSLADTARLARAMLVMDPPMAASAAQAPSLHAPSGSALLAPLVVHWRLPGFVNAVWDVGVGRMPKPLRVWPVVRPSRLLACPSNPAVSAQVKLDFERLLALHQVGDPAAVTQALSLNWLAIYRDEWARPHGLSPIHLPDSLTAYLVALWRMVNPQLVVTVPAVHQLRDRMRVALLAQPGLGQLSCAERQRLSETLIYNTVLLHSQRQGLHAAGNEAALHAAIEHYQRVGQEAWQLDLRGMRLDALGH